MRTFWKKRRQNVIERAAGDPPIFDLIDEAGTILANVQREADRFSFVAYDGKGEPFTHGREPTVERAKEKARLAAALVTK